MKNEDIDGQNIATDRLAKMKNTIKNIKIPNCGLENVTKDKRNT